MPDIGRITLQIAKNRQPAAIIAVKNGEALTGILEQKPSDDVVDLINLVKREV